MERMREERDYLVLLSENSLYTEDLMFSWAEGLLRAVCLLNGSVRA